jgi:hypothetical protein
MERIKKRTRTLKKAVLLLLAFALAAIVAAQHPVKEASAQQNEVTKHRILESYGKLPLYFGANQGQTDKQVKFLSRGKGYTLFLTPTEVVLALKNQRSAESGQSEGPSEAVQTALRMKLVAGNPAPKVMGLDELPGKSNYLIGNDPKKWHTNILHYARSLNKSFRNAAR